MPSPILRRQPGFGANASALGARGNWRACISSVRLLVVAALLAAPASSMATAGTSRSTSAPAVPIDIDALLAAPTEQLLAISVLGEAGPTTLAARSSTARGGRPAALFAAAVLANRPDQFRALLPQLAPAIPEEMLGPLLAQASAVTPSAGQAGLDEWEDASKAERAVLEARTGAKAPSAPPQPLQAAMPGGSGVTKVFGDTVTRTMGPFPRGLVDRRVVEAHPHQERASIEGSEPSEGEPFRTMVIALLLMDSTREALVEQTRQEITRGALESAREKLVRAAGHLRLRSARMADARVRAALDALAQEVDRARTTVEAVESAGDLPPEVLRARLGEVDEPWRRIRLLAPAVVQAHLETGYAFTVSEKSFIVAYVLLWHGPRIAGWRGHSFEQLLDSCPEVRLERHGERLIFLEPATGLQTGGWFVASGAIVARPTDSPLVEAASTILTMVQRATTR